MNNYEEILKSIWLDNNEAKVYLEWIKLGTFQASILWKKLWIPRTTARYACENLVTKDLMIKTKKGNSMLFTAEPPEKLTNIIRIQKNKLEESENKVNKVMKDLIWFYNPYTKLPKVTFYEWEEGIKKVLDDSLLAKETIESFVDVLATQKYIWKINEAYTENRIEKWISKKSIYENTDSIKNYLTSLYNEKWLNEIKYINNNKFTMYVSLMIYDNKISYITLKENNLFWVIIENEDIYNFHKNLFNYIWISID